MSTSLIQKVGTWEQAAALVAEQAPNAHRLPRVEEVMDADIHGAWLDETTATVWHAWADSDLHGHLTGTWFVDADTAAEAIAWLEEQCVLVLDSLADPESSYDIGTRTVEDDLEVLDELNEVRLTALRADAMHRINALRAQFSTNESSEQYRVLGGIIPTKEVTIGGVVDSQIQAGLARARAEVARWAGLRAHHLRTYTDTGRGGQARAARDLGITPVTVHNIIKEDDRRREQLIAVGSKTMTIVTSALDPSGGWQVMDREPGDSLDNAEVSAHDIGGEVGQPLLVELRDAHDNVLDSVEITAS